MFIIGNDGHAINLYHVTDLKLKSEEHGGKTYWYVIYSRDHQSDGKVILDRVETQAQATKRFQELVDGINKWIGG